MCADPTWLAWIYSYVSGEDPTITVPGFAYMLRSGSDASNTDPVATEPAEGEEWVTSPALTMFLMPGELDQNALSADHDADDPYIMWVARPTSTS